MYFVISKLGGFILTPSNAIVLLCVLGVVLIFTRFRRGGIALVATGVGLLILFGWSPLSYWMYLPLTERFQPWEGTQTPAGIIVLGGAIEAESSLARGLIETDASAERVLAMLQLARRYPDVRIIYSGGSGNLLGEPIAEAPVAGKVLDDFGLSNHRVLLESESRTTEENAANTRKLVTPKPGERWLLVTSAWHMPRSIGLYRRAGFDIDAYPVDFRSRGWRDEWSWSRRISSGLARAETAAHEWVGLAVDWLTGRSDELFPAPKPR